jgi:hypothetical protein
MDNVIEYTYIMVLKCIYSYLTILSRQFVTLSVNYGSKRIRKTVSYVVTDSDSGLWVADAARGHAVVVGRVSHATHLAGSGVIKSGLASFDSIVEKSSTSISKSAGSLLLYVEKRQALAARRKWI